MPGRLRSYEYLCAPVTIARPLTSGSDFPATFHSVASASGTLAGMVRVHFSPRASSPNSAERPPADTLPSAIASVARSTLHFRAARSSSISRAAAAARRICGHMRGEKWTRTIPASVPLAEATEWKVAGKSLPKVGGRDIVTGAHKYTYDMKRPGMLHAKMLYPPQFG